MRDVDWRCLQEWFIWDPEPAASVVPVSNLTGVETSYQILIDTWEVIPRQPITAFALTPELAKALRTALTNVTVAEELLMLQALPEPQGEQGKARREQRANATQEAITVCDRERTTNNYEHV